MNIELTKHQINSLYLLKNRADLPYVFLIGGFGCGKSFTDVMVVMWLYSIYYKSTEPICIGIIGVTIKLLKQTVLADVERMFDAAGIPYRDNSQAGTLTVGNITFVYLAMSDPDAIYAFNFHAAIVDEMDEVPAEKVKKIVTAIQERCRKRMPAPLDRDPFIFFSTTAQGLGGTYQLVKYFDKNHIPYAIVRGRTQDNPHLASSQIELLRKLYTEDEARAYLDGEFINLTTGRVYYEFVQSRHVCMRFPLNPTETIYVGQDFNYGFNASAECIVRGNKIFVVNSHHFNDMSQAASRLREMYPSNRIVFIPDASGKEIMQGVAKEFSDRNIEIYWNSKNPGIAERVMAVNKLFRADLLGVFAPDDSPSSLVDKLVMGLETRDFDDNTGKPRKGQGPEAVDHGCDSLEYAIWRIIYGIQGFEDIIKVLEKTYGRAA